MTKTKLPEFPAADETVLVRLDTAHKALHAEQKLYEDALVKAQDDLWQKHAPFITEAKSVFLQIQAEAYRAGFTDEQMHSVLSLSSQIRYTG